MLCPSHTSIYGKRRVVMIEYAIKIRREKIALSYEGYHRLWVQTNHTTIEYETIKESHAYCASKSKVRCLAKYAIIIIFYSMQAPGLEHEKLLRFSN